MTPTLDRRSYLAAAGSVALGGLAGCTGLVGRDDVVLDPPPEYEQLSEANPPYPIYGDPLPEATLPAPLHDRAVSTREFVGERHALFTFVFTRCPGACPALTANLVQVQADAAEEGYTDEIALLPVTFDPEYDTPDRIREYLDERGVDRDAGNWFFLRPETVDRAHEVVREELGVHFQDMQDDEEFDMAFEHLSMIFLVNADGFVERAYAGGPLPNPQDVIDDVHTLRDRW